MAYQTRLKVVSPQLFTADGSARGIVQIASSYLFKLNQIVVLKATGLEPLALRIRRVDSATLTVGPLKGDDKDTSDISAYTVALGATIEATEQNRPPVPEQEIERHTFEDEPVVARRVILVDENGDKFSNDNPLPTIPPVLPSEQVLFDYVGETQYIGISPSSTATSALAWKLIRVEYLDGNIMSVQYADGNNNYDNAWDDRLTKGYS